MDTLWNQYTRDLCRLYPTMGLTLELDTAPETLEDWGAALFEKERSLLQTYKDRASLALRKDHEAQMATFHTHLLTRIKCLDVDRIKLFHKNGGWSVELHYALTHSCRASTVVECVPESLRKYVEVLQAEAEARPPPRRIVEAMCRRIVLLLATHQSNLSPFFHSVKTVLLPFLQRVPCRETLGLSNLPSDIYAGSIYRHVTMDGVSADDIHTFGLAEVQRIEGLLAKLPESKPIVHRGEEAVEMYRTIVEEVEANPLLKKYFGTLRPSRPCKVKEMRAEDRSGGALAYYADGGFYVNTNYDHPEHQMEALAFHEAVPGHHLQQQIEQDKTEDPPYRWYTHHTAFVEGWAMHMESLFEPKRAHAKRGILESEIFRAVRLVVDTGIHAKGWTYEKALQFLKDHARITDDECESEVIRYACDPGQALGYHVGRVVFDDIARAHAHDIVNCYTTILRQGSVPMKFLIRQFLSRPPSS